jgi:hypothetical protein
MPTPPGSSLPVLFLADLGLERTEFADRGAIALAIIAWGLALFALIRLFSVGLATRTVTAPLDEAISEIRALTRAFPLQLCKGIAQLGLGAGLVLLLIMLTKRPREEAPLPDGWLRIRPPEECSAIALQDDLVWVGGRDGLTVLDRHSGGRLNVEISGQRIRGVKDILVEGPQVWIAHYRGVTLYQRGQPRRDYNSLNGLPPGPALSLCRDREGRLWIGTQEGAAVMEGDTVRLFTPADGLASPEVDVLFQDSSGALWFGSASPRRGGLSRLLNTKWTTYSLADGLAHDSITSIAQTTDGILWVGTGFGHVGGASRFDGTAWSSIGKSDGLAGAKVRSVFQDRDGRMWLGSEYDGITVLEGGRKTILTPDHGLVGWEVKEMVQDKDGVLWLATEDGVSRIVDPAPALKDLDVNNSQ